MGGGFQQGCEANLAAAEREMFVLTQQLQSERELREETSATLLIQSQQCTTQMDELHVRTLGRNALHCGRTHTALDCETHRFG
jgi:hypothetical protein